MLTAVILSGGAGTRLWPLSRELYPKQLLPLTGERTMLQQTVLRLEGLTAAAPVIVCNEAHRFLVAEQLRQLHITPRATVLEPFGRNTAPAIALAAHAALKGIAADANAADPVLLVLPADHVIRNVPAFQRAVRLALSAAEAGHLATFGIVASAPETGYGYIQRGAPAGAAFRIARFVEKPDAERARAFVKSGDYYWNSGMFMFRARRYLQELARFQPEMARICEAAFRGARADLDFTRIEAASFEACPADSIDYAVMEKTADAVVVPLDAGWSDIGSWSALHEASETDAHGNVVRGDVISEDTQGSYLYSESRLVAAVGLKDHVVVETKDAVLVAPKSRVQDVRKLVLHLKERGRYEHSLHREVFRPWGSYDSVESGPRFQVKRLRVKPGAALSLQMHHRRAEHWVVVAGTARITRGDEVFILEENQSTYIPVGVKHRIENPGMILLEVIEVQSGSYLGEDDIVRFEDVYGRKGTTT
ncbi:MAG TPA: mannose-1-phosphate guanylyltransferase/mannose-6-phosphate isomerase [Steroidobacteraceae bacterium]|jgi:mannose-1-phosphate guanylyltransferase/mannose-6-phosphate isomerase|nr:mannose-1-phosphate guanylyltransferase/mannose-6-phosphate isomerase [Steroidobacteraceae bacterium]